MVHLKNWFILIAGQVTGPFDQEEIQQKIKDAKAPLIWGKGQSEWLPPIKWQKSIQSGSEEKNNSIHQNQNWRIRVEGQEKKQLPYNELITYLKTISDYSIVDVTTDQLGGVWKEIFSIPKIVDDLGLVRRHHPRVPIMANMSCHGAQGSFNCRVISISEGGLGVNDARNIHIGQHFKISLTSPNLQVPITSTCEVVYVGSDGYAGFKFLSLPAEHKTTILDYVNKFASI